jgi:hypothetical protein
MDETRLVDNVQVLLWIGKLVLMMKIMNTDIGNDHHVTVKIGTFEVVTVVVYRVIGKDVAIISLTLGIKTSYPKVHTRDGRFLFFCESLKGA